MNHCDEVSIRRFREPDFCQLVRLVSETVGLSYTEVYPPRAVQFFKDYHSERKLRTAARLGQRSLLRKMGNWGAGTRPQRRILMLDCDVWLARPQPPW
jgi:hypothetical protein